MVKCLKEEFGLTKKDAQANDNEALRNSCESEHLSMVKYLKEEFGLTKKDAQANNNEALRRSCERKDRSMIEYLKDGFGLTKKDMKDFIDKVLLYLDWGWMVPYEY